MKNEENIECISPNTGASFDQWSETPVSEVRESLARVSRNSFSDLATVSSRRSVLLEISRLIEANRDEFEKIIINEVGKTRTEAVAEIDYAKSFLTYVADLIKSETFSEKFDKERKVLTVPRGIGLLITPFNDPLAGITRKLANCLGSGAGAVIKPPELGIKTASKLESIIKGRRFGHLATFIRTKDRNLVKKLIDSDEIGTVSFTGSTNVGKILSGYAGASLKPFVGELGGTNPFIIFSDGDVDKAVEDLVIRKTKSAGQACSAQNIVFVERKIASQVIDKIDEAFRNIRALPTNEFGNAKMGPVRSKSAIKNLLNFEKRLASEGAKLVCGLNGDKATGHGYMFNPVAYLSNNPQIFLQHEIFAPLMGIYIFDDRLKLKEIIRNNRQPLVLYAYSSDTEYLAEFTSALNYGSIGLNNTGIQGAFVPTGGFKQAGLGREGGVWGLRQFTTTINVRSN